MLTSTPQTYAISSLDLETGNDLISPNENLEKNGMIGLDVGILPR